MRKLLLLATMLAMALFVASPALADKEAVCHLTGNGDYVLIPPDSASTHIPNHEGDFPAPPGADSDEDCNVDEDMVDEDVDVDEDVVDEDVVDEDVDVDEDADDGGDVIIEDGDNTNNNNNENNNTNVNVNENNNTNIQSQSQSQSQTVIVNLSNFNQNVTSVIIGGITVVDLDGDGVITVFECEKQGVSQSAALTFLSTVVVEDNIVVEGDTIVTGDTVVATSDTVVTADVVTSDVSASAAVLPATGGTGGTSLLALGAGALLVAGGLLARRILR